MISKLQHLKELDEEFQVQERRDRLDYFKNLDLELYKSKCEVRVVEFTQRVKQIFNT